MENKMQIIIDTMVLKMTALIEWLKIKIQPLTETVKPWLEPYEAELILIIPIAVVVLFLAAILLKKRSRKKDQVVEPDEVAGEVLAETEKTEGEPQEPQYEAPQTEKAEMVPEEIPEEPAGLFKNIRTGLAKTRKAFSSSVDRIFAGGKLDDEMLEELEELLITSDVGVKTSMEIIENLTEKTADIGGPEDLKRLLKEEILHYINLEEKNGNALNSKPHVMMVVGVNGVGKTTTIGKLASKFVKEDKKVLIVAADTFRAAAADQLAVWAERAGADIVRHKDDSDPSAVAFDGMEAAVARDVDIVIIDTAGRLHTKKNLMEELKKIKRTISQKIPDAPHETLMVVDATTGQNALQQATLFNDAIGITTIALTKLDGTAKGGIIIGITNTLNVPLKYVGVGEQVGDLQDFDPKEFADALI